MTNDDERRKVAKLLRERAGYEMGCVFKELYGDCNSAGPTCGECNERAMRYVADLIEPSCDRDTPQKVAEEMFGKMRHSMKEEADAYDDMLKSKSVEIHPVDRDALLALADEMDDTSCDKRGELSVSLGDIWGWSEAIYEALGVQDV